MKAGNLTVEALDATFGAQVRGVHLADIDAPTFVELYAAWLEYGLLIFSGQFLSHDQQIAFARRFGELEFEIAALSNVLPNGELRAEDATDDVIKVLKGNMAWHHDSTFMPVQAKGAVFSAEIVSRDGGATGFADMRAAYDALDKDTSARIENLRAHHSLYHSQAKVGHHGQRGPHQSKPELSDPYSGYGFHDGPISLRPLVKRHPETGRKNLLVGRHAYDVIGLSERESATLLSELMDFACQAPRIYNHQ